MIHSKCERQEAQHRKYRVGWQNWPHNWLLALGLTLSLATMCGCSDSPPTVKVASAKATWFSLPDLPLDPRKQPKSDTSIPPSESVPEKSILIGLDVDLSHHTKIGGEAIRRGALLAIDQRNARGGVLGKQLHLVVRDHHGNPTRGVDNIRKFAQMPNLVAVLGGVHTPVAIEELAAIHECKMIYLGPWAAGTPVVQNGYSPNYVFRVSVSDQFAGEFLVRSAIQRGYDRIGLLLEQTAWGRSNELALTVALDARQLAPASRAWFLWDEPTLQKQIIQLLEAGSTAIILVANTPEAASAVSYMASLPEERRVPLFSHWGILSGEFATYAASSLPKVDLAFLQTFSFDNPRFPNRASRIAEAYCHKFTECQAANDINAPFATAHAFDLVNMLCEAMERCGTTDRIQLRKALEELPFHAGVVRDYAPPFTATDHDALDLSDLQLMQFDATGRAIAIRPEAQQ